MHVAKYWRNNGLRYRMQGLVQNKVERKIKSAPVKLESTQQNTQQPVLSKVG